MSSDITYLRLSNQHLLSNKLKDPASAVQWLGAVQAQDFAAAKWALGLRTNGQSDASIEKVFNEGHILRTHILRPTWHFVHKDDLRWMLMLSAQKVDKRMGFYNRQLGITAELRKQARRILEKILSGKSLTKNEITKQLSEKNIKLDSQTCTQLLFCLEIDAVVCSGPLQNGKQTYMLFDEHVPATNNFNDEDALVELAKRYFQSHGPATEKDFAWWSGLSIADARKAIALNESNLSHESEEGQIYWYSRKLSPITREQLLLLLPNYDEYIVSYQDRHHIFDKENLVHLDSRANPLFQHTILWNGEIVGTWKRIKQKERVIVEPTFFMSPTDEQLQFLKLSVANYEHFLKA